MWQRFTEMARKTLFFAQEEAQQCGEGYVAPEHLLLGLLRQPDSVACIVLTKLAIDLLGLKRAIERQLVKDEARAVQDMTLTPRAKRVIDLAYDEARKLDNNYIGTEHLLLGLIREGDGLPGRTLTALGATLEAARQWVMELQQKEDKKEPLSQTVQPAEAIRVDQWSDYSPAGKATIYRAFAERAQFGHPTVTAEHFLLAVSSDPVSVAAKVLADLGATPEKIRAALQAEFASQPAPEE